jgi:predicted nuclease with TOPRIM domain
LSGTVAIKKQTAWLRKSNEELRKSTEELRKSNEDARKSNEDARIQHEQRLRELRKENARLAELELKLDAALPKSVSN